MIRCSLLLALIAFGSLTAGTSATLQPAAGAASTQAAFQLPNETGSVKFAVIGDSGTGARRQYEVAERMAIAHRVFPFTFVIMLGDNLYGSERPDDYERKFERPYAPLLAAGVKFYAALGNHDEPDQRHYEPFNMNGRRYYTHDHGEVRFFVLDSNRLDPDQVAWLERELASSEEPWKIVYLHHPLYSSGERHGGEEELRELLEPLFVKHGVSAVFAGHDHFYERLEPQQGIHYFVSGAAGKLRRNNLRENSALTARGFDSDYSFMLVEIVGDELHFECIARDGRLVDRGVVPRVVRETVPTR
ncbi:MAG TPA: metallophosphoesterase [Vicinamibacterales bacterium]